LDGGKRKKGCGDGKVGRLLAGEKESKDPIKKGTVLVEKEEIYLGFLWTFILSKAYISE